MISGPEKLGDSQHFQNTPHYLNANALCNHFDIPYFECNSMASLGPLFRHVQDHENTCVLEVKTDSDGWTIRTIDGEVSAHFEHTIAITSDGPKILSKSRLNG